MKVVSNSEAKEGKRRIDELYAMAKDSHVMLKYLAQALGLDPADTSTTWEVVAQKYHDVHEQLRTLGHEMQEVNDEIEEEIKAEREAELSSVTSD